MTDTVKFQQAASSFEKYAHAEQERLHESVKKEFGDLAQQTEVFSKRLEDLRLHINERLKARGIEPFRFNQRRLLRNYRQFRLTTAPFLNDIRRKQEDAKQNQKNKK